MLIAVVGMLLGGCAKSEKVTQGTVAAGGQQSSIAEVQPVTVAGESLAKVDSFTNDPAIGKDAPGLSGYNFQGDPVKLDWSAGPTMVVFLAHWCGHCNAEVPILIQWKNSGQMPANLKVVGITTAVSPSQANYPPSRWLPGFGWPWPILADSAANEAATAFGVGSYPYFVIVGTDGKVKLRNSGQVPANQLTPMVAAALNS